MIVAIITVIGSLVLVTRNSGLARLGAVRIIRLALIWAAIILSVVLLIQAFGIRTGG